jgi:hypothetical protein
VDAGADRSPNIILNKRCVFRSNPVNFGNGPVTVAVFEFTQKPAFHRYFFAHARGRGSAFISD